jgi:spore coat polysaccharide biosynthesis protein SpsF
MKAVILQVRLDSTRLPGKALLPLAGRPAVLRAMDALRLIPADSYILATEPGSAGPLSPLADEAGFELFVGNKENVLRRYADAARKYEPDAVIRATGDNPLVSWEMAVAACALFDSTGADYAALSDLPLGAGVEVIGTSALLEADRSETDSYEKEHVTPFLYRRPDRFRIVRSQAPHRYRRPDLRVTMDTSEDYRFLSGVFEALKDRMPVPLLDLIDFLDRTKGRNP